MQKNQMLLFAGMLALILFPGSLEAKKKRINEESLRPIRSGGKVHSVQETIDLSGYGIIDEDRRLNLQFRLEKLVMAHNQRLREKRSKVKYSRFSENSSNKTTFENFHILDIGQYGIIEEDDLKIIQKQLDDLIARHNLYASGKIKRPGTVRLRK